MPTIQLQTMCLCKNFYQSNHAQASIKVIMQKLLSVLIALCCSIAMSAQGIAFEPDGTTLEQASAKAKAVNKLIFLDCYTSWCGPCKKMARDIFPQETVGKFMNPKYVCLKIDMESAYGAPLAKKLQISAYPTFIIFNANAQEIGRFLGGSEADEFIKRVKEKSTDNSGSDLEQRWKNGDRDPQFLKDYLKTLTATHKADEANDVAEAILAGKESTFADDAELRNIFMRNVNNPFCASFRYTLEHPEALKTAAGDKAVDQKIQNVFTNYQRQLVVEGDGTATLDQANYDKFAALLRETKVPDANHYLLSTLITLAEKQKDYPAYIQHINEYLADTSIDADDMQIARWARPFSSPDAPADCKQAMVDIMKQRIADIEAGKRTAMTKVGNMTLSVPTDELLRRVIDALNG